jgi:methylglyoxal/glyoxal reductase
MSVKMTLIHSFLRTPYIKEMDIQSKVFLNNGVEMPWLGLGVLRLNENGEVEKAVKSALKNGYRSIDTAAAYHNEAGVGRAIRESGIPREEIFITTKVNNNQQGYKETIDAFYQSLEYLQTDYIDLYLIHWPKGKKSLRTWKAMVKLYKEGLIRAIGVSNFKIHHLEYLMTFSDIVPAVNQIELHPRHSQPELVKFCKKHDIQVVAWSPLLKGEVTRMPAIKEIASRYGKTAAEIVLRWNLQKGIVTIPKSGNPARIAENSAIFDFELGKNDIAKIDRLNRNQPLLAYRDKTVHLLQMLVKYLFHKAFFSSLINYCFIRIQKISSNFLLFFRRRYKMN